MTTTTFNNTSSTHPLLGDTPVEIIRPSELREDDTFWFADELDFGSVQVFQNTTKPLVVKNLSPRLPLRVTLAARSVCVFCRFRKFKPLVPGYMQSQYVPFFLTRSYGVYDSFHRLLVPPMQNATFVVMFLPDQAGNVSSTAVVKASFVRVGSNTSKLSIVDQWRWSVPLRAVGTPNQLGLATLTPPPAAMGIGRRQSWPKLTALATYDWVLNVSNPADESLVVLDVVHLTEVAHLTEAGLAVTDLGVPFYTTMYRETVAPHSTDTVAHLSFNCSSFSEIIEFVAVRTSSGDFVMPFAFICARADTCNAAVPAQIVETSSLGRHPELEQPFAVTAALSHRVANAGTRWDDTHSATVSASVVDFGTADTCTIKSREILVSNASPSKHLVIGIIGVQSRVTPTTSSYHALGKQFYVPASPSGRKPPLPIKPTAEAKHQTQRRSFGQLINFPTRPPHPRTGWRRPTHILAVAAVPPLTKHYPFELHFLPETAGAVNHAVELVGYFTSSDGGHGDAGAMFWNRTISLRGRAFDNPWGVAAFQQSGVLPTVRQLSEYTLTIPIRSPPHDMVPAHVGYGGRTFKRHTRPVAIYDWKTWPEMWDCRSIMFLKPARHDTYGRNPAYLHSLAANESYNMRMVWNVSWGNKGTRKMCLFDVLTSEGNFTVPLRFITGDHTVTDPMLPGRIVPMSLDEQITSLQSPVVDAPPPTPPRVDINPNNTDASGLLFAGATTITVMLVTLLVTLIASVVWWWLRRCRNRGSTSRGGGGRDQNVTRLLQWEKTADGQPLHVLGHGAQGLVFRGTYYGRTSAGESVAVKEVQTHMLQLRDEREILARLQHPNIVKYYQFLQEGTLTRIVLELCEAESLGKAMARSTMDALLQHSICMQLTQGLAYLHSRQIVHRDLKPSNVLLKDQTVKIADFGVSKQLGGLVSTRHNTLSGAFGTTGFQAPEMLLEGHSGNEGVDGLGGGGGNSVQPPRVDQKRADVFSLGVVMHIVLTRLHPFGQDEHERNANICRGRSAVLVPVDQHSARMMVEALIHQQPGARPCDGGDVLRRFQPFFNLPHLLDCSKTLAGLVTFASDFLGRGYCKPTSTCPDDVRRHRQSLTEMLEDAMQPHLARTFQAIHCVGADEPAYDWTAAVPTPNNGRWNRPPAETFARFTNTERMPRRRPLPGYALVCWSRNFYSHVGTSVGRRMFDCPADADAFLKTRFPWLQQTLYEFALQHLPRLTFQQSPSDDDGIDDDVSGGGGAGGGGGGGRDKEMR